MDIDNPDSSTASPPRMGWIADIPVGVLRGLHRLRPSSANIPRSCLKKWAHLLGHCLADLNSRLRRGVPATFAPIAAIAAIVLAVPHTADSIHARIDAVNKSDWVGAFQLAQRAAASQRPRGAQHTAARASAYMEQKAIRKAVAALQRQPVTADPNVIAASIRDKLPPQRHTWQHTSAPPSCAPSPIEGTSARKWRDKVWAALCSTAPCAAPGPSALRREHLEVAAKIGSARIPVHLANIIGAICAGMVPADDRFITASMISPVPKKEPGDFRPIGVGEILRRIAGRIGLSVLLKHVGPDLHAKGQFGTSPDGGHHVYETVRQCAAKGQFVVGVDLANAFCTVDREKVLHAVQGLPDVKPLVEALYGNESDMLLRSSGDIIVSDRGVVQGCPLASVLFSMTIQPAIDYARFQLAQDGLSVSDVWYADDGTVASHSAPALHAFLGYLRDAMADLGLTFSTKKAKFIAPASCADDHEDVKLLETLAIRVPLIVCVGLPVCPLGQHDAESRIAHHFDVLVSSACEVVTKLRQLEHPQHIVQALAMAGSWSRLQYYVRGYAGLLPTDALHRAELADIDTLRVACGEHANSVDVPQWLVASLPLRDGGLGIHSVTAEAAIHAALRPPIAHDAPGTCPPPPKQGALMGARDHMALATTDILRKCWSSAKMAALMDAATPAARAWLSAPLRRADNTLVTNPRTAATIVAHAIGCDIFPAGYPCLRRGESCRPSQLPCCDPAGQHVTNCAYLFTRRHHAIRNTLFGELKEHAPHVSPMIEQGCRQGDGEPYDPPNDADRVGDVVLRDHASASWMFIDVVVGGLAQHLIVKATRKRGVYPNEQHEKKMRDPRRTAVLAAKQQHVILAFGPSGSPSYHTNKFLRKLAHIIDPAHHGSLGTGKGAYTTAQRLLAKCQVAMLTATAERAVELADELHATDPRHCDTALVRAAEDASARTVSDIWGEMRSSHNPATRSRLGAVPALREPASAAGASAAVCAMVPTPPNLATSNITAPPIHPCSPHRWPSIENTSTALRGGRHVDGWPDDRSVRSPRQTAGASAGASAAGTAAADDIGHSGDNADQYTRRPSPPVGASAASSVTNPDAAAAAATPNTHHGGTTPNMGRGYVKESLRRVTDPATGAISYQLWPAYLRGPRGSARRSAPMAAEAPSQRDSSHTSNGHRGEPDPRRLDNPSRSSPDDPT